jgi:hypothetical protein
MRRLIPLLLVAVLAAVAVPTAASAASYGKCRGSDRANGIVAVWALRTTCSQAVAVARRTNSVKCFLNGNRCTHRFRGRAWTCTLSRSGESVTCRAGGRGVRYRLG